MFKEIPLDGFYHLIGHGPCVLVTSGKGEEINVAPIAWNTPVNDEPPLAAVAIASTHYTAELIKKHGEFVINIPDEKLLPAIMECGKVSGRKGNKFKKAGLSPQPGVKVQTPSIKECIGFLELKVRDAREYDGVVLFIGSVVYCAVREGLYDDYWITEKAKTIHHLGSSYFMVSGKRIKAG